jgi:hypothetical protein
LISISPGLIGEKLAQTAARDGSVGAVGSPEIGVGCAVGGRGVSGGVGEDDANELIFISSTAIPLGTVKLTTAEVSGEYTVRVVSV